MQVSTLQSKINTFISLLSEPSKMILPFSQSGLLKWLPDKAFLKIAYKAELGQKLNLQHPALFSEKLQWLKLNDHKAIYSSLVDKYIVKDIIGSKIGKEYIIPTYGVWEDAKEIRFDRLPDAFVLKCNHDSGGVVVCKNKNTFNIDEAIRKLNTHLYRSAYWSTREWPYKNVKRKIFAEQLLLDPEHEDLIDYKFYCFGGEPEYCQVIRDRNGDETIDFYDMEWNEMPFTGLGLKSKKGKSVIKPDNFEKMIELARILSKGVVFVRIDLYNISGKIYFGEFTLYPASGFGRFVPNEWNEIIGDMVNLPI